MKLDSEEIHSPLFTPPTQYSILWLVFSVVLAAVSMLCKEQGITVLAVCLAYDLFVASGKDFMEFFVILKRAMAVLLTKKNDDSKKRLT